MADQFPVEIRYGVIWRGEIEGIHECKEDAVEEAASCCKVEKKLGVAQVVDLEVRVLNQPPCPWELESFYLPDNGSWCKKLGFVYCPECGRKLT